MLSEESGVNKQESTNIVSQAAPAAPSLSTRPLTTPPPSANANERTSLSQSHPLIESRNLVISGGQFHHTLGHHTNLAIHINQGSPVDFRSSSPPLNESCNINTAQFPDQSSQVDHERNQSQGSSQSPESSFQKSNDIYERHFRLKGRGFPLWIPDPNRVLHLSYRRTGVRIGDVGIITESGAFSFLFNICLPHNDPVNPRMLPEHFAPISPPIEATDIENFKVFKNGDHLSSGSVRRSQTGTAISDIVFESSASEGAILTMPRGARSEKLGNLARFREYEAANIANWYRFVNGPRGREAKNGDVRLVVGFDKTTSWGIATFANQTQQNSCHFKFGPSEGDSASTYTWSEYSGVADVRAGPDSDEIDELRIDSDPPDVQFENQCLFVRTLNVTLADDVWADIHSSSGSNPVDPRDSQYPRVKNYSDSNRPHSNNPDNGSTNLSPSQGAQSGTQRRLQGVDNTSDNKTPIFVSGPVESITAHPSKVLNDTLLARIPNAKMVITHDDDWSSVTQPDTLVDPHEFVANILASRVICQENGVVFLEPKKIINKISEGSTSVNPAQEATVMQGSPLMRQMPQNKQRNQKMVLELASLPGNNTCADCKTRLPRWASHNLGIFICVNCASIHRKIGTHITKVKSLTMDDWTKEQVENMKSIGNINSNKIYNPNEIRNPPPPNLEESERDSEIEQYIRAKYEYRKFFEKSALVASKLGHSQPASSTQVPAAISRHPFSITRRSSAHTRNLPVAASTASSSSYKPPPPKPPQMIPAFQPPQPSGVWDDINSLKGNYNISQNSSLPLQYQQPTYSQGNSMQLPAFNSALGVNNNYFVGGLTSGMGLVRKKNNLCQSDQVRTNPFFQQQSRPSFPPSSMTSSFSTTPTMSSQPFGEQSFGVSQSSASLPDTPAYYNPQPQNSFQIQNPSGESFISGSPIHPFPSTQPTGQPRLSPQNHNSSIPRRQQYISQYISHSLQPMQSSPTNTQFMYQSPGPVQPQIGGGHNVSGESQILGMTTMQMQQQMEQQQEQMHQPQQPDQNYYPSMQPDDQ